MEAMTHSGAVVANHRSIVACGFRVGSLVLGVPALVALVVLCVTLFHPAAPDRSSYLDIGTYGIAGLLANTAHGVGQVFGWFGGIARWIGKLLAIGFAAILAWAAMLYFVGRGVARRSAPARFVGLIASVACLLISVLALLALPRGMMLASGLGTVLSAYVIWVLGWRYA